MGLLYEKSNLAVAAFSVILQLGALPILLVANKKRATVRWIRTQNQKSERSAPSVRRSHICRDPQTHGRAVTARRRSKPSRRNGAPSKRQHADI